ncbi:hypothetical protein ABZ791_38015 [Streptomyces huasconensis]|uniref:Uncharacterized protein n=1 Tax=Streptomyces huasconensis TaxID=1854574 RepID=A0ABV3M7K7_9ACTN
MSQQRSGITKYISNILDDTKTMIDEILDKARDFETDARDSISRNVGTKDTKQDVVPRQPGAELGQQPVTQAEAAALYTRLGHIEELLRHIQTGTPSTEDKTAGKSSP